MNYSIMKSAIPFAMFLVFFVSQSANAQIPIGSMLEITGASFGAPTPEIAVAEATADFWDQVQSLNSWDNGWWSDGPTVITVLPLPDGTFSATAQGVATYSHILMAVDEFQHLPFHDCIEMGLGNPCVRNSGSP